MGCCQSTSDVSIAETIVSAGNDTVDTLSQQDVSKRSAPNLLKLEQIHSFSATESATTNGMNGLQTASSIPIMQYPVDLDLFQSLSLNININEECRGVMDRECVRLQRLKAMLLYHGTLSIDQFISFCDALYPKQALLADYIHFVDRHSDRISKRSIVDDDIWSKMDCVDCECGCIAMKRHFDCSATNHFCVDLADSVHFIVFHNDDGVDIGNAEESESKLVSNCECKENEDALNLIDPKLQSMAKAMNEKMSSFNYRLDDATNRKFKLCVLESAGNTLMDTLRAFTTRKGIDFVDSLIGGIVDDEHDSDSIKEDLRIWEEEGECNVFTADSVHLGIGAVMKQQSAPRARAFNSGIRFWYWSYYQNIYRLDEAVEGRTVSDLYVAPKWSNLKEEVMASGLVSMRHFEHNVVSKAMEYIQTAKCRAIRRNPDRLHFHVEAFSVQHLQAIILWTDFMAFSSAMAASLQKEEWTESVEEVRARNVCYHFTSKLLRESVYLFGLDHYRFGSKNGRDIESGPFFVATNSVLPIPSFSVSFGALTSMTKNVQIAWRVAMPQGMVLEMNTTASYSKRERFFNAKWISRFPQESQRIFGSNLNITDSQRLCGLTLSAIVNVQSFRNYRLSVGAFHKLETMVRGEKDVHKMRVTAKEVEVLRDVVEWSMARKCKSSNLQCTELDQFILQCFDWFSLRTTCLVLHFEALAKIKVEHSQISIHQMFVGPLVLQREELDVDSTRNLLKWTLFGIFGEMKSMKIRAKHYAFNLKAFLLMLSHHEMPPNLEQIVIDGMKPENGGMTEEEMASMNIDFDGRDIITIHIRHCFISDSAELVVEEEADTLFNETRI